MQDVIRVVNMECGLWCMAGASKLRDLLARSLLEFKLPRGSRHLFFSPGAAVVARLVYYFFYLPY